MWQYNEFNIDTQQMDAIFINSKNSELGAIFTKVRA